MFWHLSICISLFVQTNRASTCMFIWQTNTDKQIDNTWHVFFQRIICKLHVCRTESPSFTDKLYKLVILLCEGSAKAYKTMHQEWETHLCFYKPRIGLTMVGLYLFGAQEGFGWVLALFNFFEFLCRRKCIFCWVFSRSATYLPVK